MVPALTSLLERVDVKVRQTRRRQGLQAVLAILPPALTISLLLATLAAILLPLLGIGLPLWVIPAAGASAAVLAACLWAARKVPNRAGAALALDRAFGLQERLVTISTISAVQRTSEAGTLLARDMETHIGRVDVGQGFPLPFHGRRWLAPLGAAIALTGALLFPSAWSLAGIAPSAEKETEKRTKEAEKKSIDLTAFKQANEERKKRLKEIGSQTLNDIQHDIDQLLQRLEQTKEGSSEARLALEDLTKLSEKVRANESAKEKIDDIKKQLKLELGDKIPAEKGQAEQFTQALSQANFEKAREELLKLAEKMQKGEMSKEQMKELAKQMANLRNKLDEIAKQKERLESLEKSSLDPETKQKEREKIEKEIEKLKDLAELAEQMKEAAQELQKGDMEAAREALEKMAEELQKMDLSEQELGELQIAEGDLEDLKAAIAGMKARAGKRGKKGDPWGGDKDWGGEGQPGQQGWGGKVGDASEGGTRDETLDKTKSEDDTIKGKSNPAGKMTVVGQGPKQSKPGKDQIKSRAELTVAELDQAKQQASEALKQQKISQSQRDVVNEFYKNLAPGEKK